MNLGGLTRAARCRNVIHFATDRRSSRPLWKHVGSCPDCEDHPGIDPGVIRQSMVDGLHVVVPLTAVPEATDAQS